MRPVSMFSNGPDSDMLRCARLLVPTPGTNRQVTVFGVAEVSTGAWEYRLGRRCAADFIALLDQLLRAFPAAPVIAMICGNDSIDHARKLTSYLEEHPRLELMYSTRYSPHDNPVERIWAGPTSESGPTLPELFRPRRLEEAGPRDSNRRTSKVCSSPKPDDPAD
jgi:hypothetical protein